MLIKKIVSGFCAVIVSATVASAVFSSANEDERVSVPAGLKFEEYDEAEYLDTLSEEEQDKRNRVLQEMERMESCDISVASSYKISVPGTFTMYQQIYNDYCLPACVKSIIHYINGSSEGQEDIARDGCKDYLYRARIYLNEHQSQCNYLEQTNPAKHFITSAVYTTINEEKAPCILGINTTLTNNWHYQTEGHAVVVNAIQSDKSKMQIADPLGGYSNWAYYYEKDADTIAAVCGDMLY
ncbi:MAG: hypothetical protein J6K77_08880 [Ruminococcus sp.]|nr:hypothetical protein [Ruminococcus sp.]